MEKKFFTIIEDEFPQRTGLKKRPAIAIFNGGYEMIFRAEVGGLAPTEFVRQMQKAIKENREVYETDNLYSLKNLPLGRKFFASENCRNFKCEVSSRMVKNEILIPLEIETVDGFGFASKESGMSSKEYVDFNFPMFSQHSKEKVLSKMGGFIGRKFSIKLTPTKEPNIFNACVHLYLCEIDGTIVGAVTAPIFSMFEVKTDVSLILGKPLRFGGLKREIITEKGREMVETFITLTLSESPIIKK